MYFLFQLISDPDVDKWSSSSRLTLNTARASSTVTSPTSPIGLTTATSPVSLGGGSASSSANKPPIFPSSAESPSSMRSPPISLPANLSSPVPPKVMHSDKCGL